MPLTAKILNDEQENNTNQDFINAKFDTNQEKGENMSTYIHFTEQQK